MRLLIYIFIASVFFLFSCKSLAPAGGGDDVIEVQFYVDELAQSYTISPNNTIVKYDQDGKKLFEYSDNTLGPITSFDASNPLQILAFYERFQAIKIFDRTMNLTNEIDLNKLDLFEIHAVGSSNDNNFWLFDELNQELLKIDKQGKIQGRNNDLRLRLEKNSTPHYIVEYQNMVYLFDEEHGILIFNNFGEYITQRAFTTPTDFRYLLGYLFYDEGSELMSYSLIDGSKKSQSLPVDLSIGKSQYVLNDKLIYIEEGKVKMKQF